MKFFYGAMSERELRDRSQQGKGIKLQTADLA